MVRGGEPTVCFGLAALGVGFVDTEGGLGLTIVLYYWLGRDFDTPYTMYGLSSR